jgi:uncharacterized protein (DUF2235 family)
MAILRIQKAQVPMTETAAASSEARKLAVFLDGTWDRAFGNTNVWRLKSLCAPRPDQLVFYSEGVGTSLADRLRGGVFGYGIDDQLTLAYQWLVENYHDGDELFVFGFSRGAFAARSLSGLISRCGLLKLGAPCQSTSSTPGTAAVTTRNQSTSFASPASTRPNSPMRSAG